MKYITVNLVIFLSTTCITHAQTATMPKAPPQQPSQTAPAAPTAAPAAASTGMLPLNGGPCEAEMKAAVKKMSEIAPGKNIQALTPAEMNTPEAKAVQDCLKKNASKGGAAAPLIPSAGKTGAVVPSSSKTQVKATQTGAPAAASIKNMPPPVVKQSVKEVSTQCPHITKDLKVGLWDAEVIVLKKFLAQEGVLKGIQNTNYFGPMTEKALKEWQKKKGIAQSGMTDTATRAAIKNCTQQKSLPAKASGAKK